MSPTKAAARRAGVLYVLMGVPAALSLSISRRFVVPGDAATTLRNIAAGEMTFRLGILSLLVSSVFMLYLALSLYDLLKDVDRKQARAMLVLAFVMVALGLANLSNQIAPLVLSSGADFLSVFSKPQLDALALGFLRVGSNTTYVGMAFWGLWLLPFGVLVFKSGFFPRVLGVLLIVGCFAYLAVSVTGVLFPAQGPAAFRIMLPFYGVGELAMVLWLLIKGVRTEPAVA